MSNCFHMKAKSNEKFNYLKWCIDDKKTSLYIHPFSYCQLIVMKKLWHEKDMSMMIFIVSIALLKINVLYDIEDNFKSLQLRTWDAFSGYLLFFVSIVIFFMMFWFDFTSAVNATITIPYCNCNLLWHCHVMDVLLWEWELIEDILENSTREIMQLLIAKKNQLY